MTCINSFLRDVDYVCTTYTRHLFDLGSEPLFSSYAGYFYSLKLPLRRELDSGIRSLLESGVMDKVGPATKLFSLAVWQHLYFPVLQLRSTYEWILTRPGREMARKAKGRDGVAAPLSLSHLMAPTLVVLAAGAAVIAISCPFEFLVGRRGSKARGRRGEGHEGGGVARL